MAETPLTAGDALSGRQQSKEHYEFSHTENQTTASNINPQNVFRMDPYCDETMASQCVGVRGPLRCYFGWLCFATNDESAANDRSGNRCHGV